MKERLARRARRAVNLSQERFADLIGTHYNVVQRWERGKTQPSGPIRALLELLEKEPAVCLSVLRPDEPVSLPPPPEEPTKLKEHTPVATTGFTSLSPDAATDKDDKFTGDGGPPPADEGPPGYDLSWGNLQ